MTLSDFVELVKASGYKVFRGQYCVDISNKHTPCASVSLCNYADGWVNTQSIDDEVEKLGFETYRGNNVVSIKKAEVVVASVPVDKWARYDLSSRSGDYHIDLWNTPEEYTELTSEVVPKYALTPIEERA